MEKYFDINNNHLNIKCKLYYNDIHNINRVLISCHGFAGSKENNASKKLSEEILPKYDDIAIFTFDLPCHGKDVRQKISLKDCNDYYEEVINYTKNRFNKNEIYLNATSFGGYLSLKYLHEHDNPFKRIILRCPAVTMFKVLSNDILTEENKELLSNGKDILFGYDRELKITKEFVDDLKKYDINEYDYRTFSGIIEVYHGTSDELVPIEDVRGFCLKNNLTFYEVEDADHRFQEPSKIHYFVKKGTEFLFNNVKHL